MPRVVKLSFRFVLSCSVRFGSVRLPTPTTLLSFLRSADVSLLSTFPTDSLETLEKLSNSRERTNECMAVSQVRRAMGMAEGTGCTVVRELWNWSSAASFFLACERRFDAVRVLSLSLSGCANKSCAGMCVSQARFESFGSSRIYMNCISNLKRTKTNCVTDQTILKFVNLRLALYIYYYYAMSCAPFNRLSNESRDDVTHLRGVMSIIHMSRSSKTFVSSLPAQRQKDKIRILWERNILLYDLRDRHTVRGCLQCYIRYLSSSASKSNYAKCHSHTGTTAK